MRGLRPSRLKQKDWTKVIMEMPATIGYLLSSMGCGYLYHELSKVVRLTLRHWSSILLASLQASLSTQQRGVGMKELHYRD